MADVLFAKQPGKEPPPQLDELLAGPSENLLAGPAPAATPATAAATGQVAHVAVPSHSRSLLDDDRQVPLI
jgi:hypothetical protein